MLALRIFAPLSAQFGTLEANAEQAGRALACSYSSSDEFEAALIAERREAGIYSRPRRRRRLWAAAMLFAALLLAGSFILV